MYNHMYNHIILSAGLFGSCYLFGKSLQLVNTTVLENKKIPNELHVLNIFTFMLSGTLVCANYYVLYKQLKS